MSRKKPSQRFGEKLQTLRTEHGLTLQQMARLLGLSSHSHIIALESGEKSPGLRLVLTISRRFNVTTDQLLKDELELEIDHAIEPLGGGASRQRKKRDSKSRKRADERDCDERKE